MKPVLSGTEIQPIVPCTNVSPTVFQNKWRVAWLLPRPGARPSPRPSSSAATTAPLHWRGGR